MFKHFVLFILIIWAVLALGGGEYIDQRCIEGRFSEQQAAIHNLQVWGKCPTYRTRGGLTCQARERDRVLKHQCSEFGRDFTLRNNKTLKRLRHNVQEFLFGERF